MPETSSHATTSKMKGLPHAAGFCPLPQYCLFRAVQRTDKGPCPHLSGAGLDATLEAQSCFCFDDDEC